jgi:plasmid stabilization system protein ParE
MDKKYEVILTTDAQLDINSISYFFYDLIGLDSAEKFIDSLYSTLEKLEKNPRMNKRLSDNYLENIRRVHLPKHKVCIIYKIDDYKLKVIAIATWHILQNPKNLQSILNKRLDKYSKQ